LGVWGEVLRDWIVGWDGLGQGGELGFQFLLSVEEFDADGQGVEGEWTETVESDLDEVFRGAEDGVGCRVMAPLSKLFDVVAIVAVMIGEFSEGNDVVSAGVEGMAEAGGVSDAAEGGNWATAQVVERFGLAAGGEKLLRGVDHFGPRGVGSKPSDSGANGGSLVGIDHVGSGEDHGVGAAQSGEGFSQRAAGKDVFEAERFEGVDENDVEIAVDATMLEGIVEEDHLAAEFFDGDGRGADSIGVLQVGNVGQLVFEFNGFVVAASGFGAVAAADKGDTHALVSEEPGDPCNHRRLAGSAEGEIADADDGDTDVVDKGCISVVAAVSPTDGDDVGEFGTGEDGTEAGCAESFPPTADQLVKLGGGQHLGTGSIGSF